VTIVRSRSQGPGAPVIVEYRFLDTGACASRVLPEFLSAFVRELRGALAGLEPWVRVHAARSLSAADRGRLGR
jgi:hypothetical protein